MFSTVRPRRHILRRNSMNIYTILSDAIRYKSFNIAEILIDIWSKINIIKLWIGVSRYDWQEVFEIFDPDRFAHYGVGYFKRN